MARDVTSYTNVRSRPYIHLTDGGVSDNIGARNIMRALSLPESEIPLAGMVQSGKIQRLLLVVVDAKVGNDPEIDLRSHSPSILGTFFGAVDAPVNNYSELSIESLYRAVEDLQEKNSAVACSNGSKSGCLSMFYTVELSFDQIADNDERRFFERLPTSYALDRPVVDALIARGGQLLRMHPEYNRLLCDLERGAWNKRGATAACRDQAYPGVQAPR